MNIRIWIGLILAGWSGIIFGQQTATVTSDKQWGLLIGDIVTVQATLPVEHRQIDPTTLPQSGKRYGPWLFLKGMETASDTLIFYYQVTNVPQTNLTINTPEFTLRALTDEFILVPETSMTIGPLLPSGQQTAHGEIVPQPDQMPRLISTAQQQMYLKIAVAIIIILSSVLLVWHIGWKFSRRQPFAQAVHELAMLRWHRTKQSHQAARILHAAFNQTAGTVVAHRELDHFLDQVGWLQPLRDEITQFYELSAHHFFSREGAQEPDFATVMKLAKACRSREKLA